MVLISRFIRLIEGHAESLSLQWVEEIRSNPLTAGYAKLPKQQLHDIVFSRFRRLGGWMEKNEGVDREIAHEFIATGQERATSGIKVSEMVYSLMLERDLLWRHILDEGIVAEGIDLNRAIEFSGRLNYFYEKALYFAVVGYENYTGPIDAERDEGFFESIFEGFKHWIVIQ
ncbi:MAG: hypothetical protein RAO75_04675 [Candidatus Chlorobium antarcticum]|jgi:hypothetical protein|nr:hypothetical protein [Candidatus Chlorobium antarcticum]